MSKKKDLMASIVKGEYEEVRNLLTKNELTTFTNSKFDHGAYQILCTAAAQRDTDILSLVLTAFPEVNYAFSPPPLFTAVLSGHEKTVKLLLDKGADVQDTNFEGSNNAFISDRKLTALHLAAREGFNNIVDLLLSRRADINTIDSLGGCPLHVSVKHPIVVQLLLSKGARNDARDYVQQTALHKATSHGQLDSVKVLLHHGSNVNAKDSYGQTPLHIASERNLVIVAYLLDQSANINEADNFGKTSLHRAVSLASSKTVKLLIDRGANIEAAEYTLNQRPLHLAALNGEEEDVTVVKLLLHAGASVHVRDNRGDTPLTLAIKHANSGKKELVTLLLDKKGTADIQYGEQLLNLAAKHSSYVLEYLIQRGIDMNNPNESEQTVLFNAAINGYSGAVELLLKYGAKLRTGYVQQDIAEIARKSSHAILKRILGAYPTVKFHRVQGLGELFRIGSLVDLENAALLIQRGADPKEQFNFKGIVARTALMHAISNEMYKEAESILDAGADINETSVFRGLVKSPLYYFFTNPKCRAVEWCLRKGADVNILPPDWNPELYKTKMIYIASVKKILKQVAIMEHLQVNVNDRLTDFIMSHDAFVKYKDMCEREVRSLAEETFCGSITLFDILVASKNQLVMYAGNEFFEDSEEIKRMYEWKNMVYGCDIISRAREGVYRRKLLDGAGYHFGQVTFPRLPKMIADMIIKFLNDDDLKMILSACKKF